MARKEAIRPTRPPVVAIMGHVDHGKTTLLDYIRRSHLTQKEFGGITQHITAYQAQFQEKKITFVDTPGHAAFETMRLRGAQVTDLVLLVVAANEGVKPQTVEAIKHIQKEKVPLIVVLNKMDAPGANPEKIKKQLSEHEVYVEGYGGDVVTVEVSAKTGNGVDALLEMILLVSDMRELQSHPEKEPELTVIDSHIDKKKGPVVSVIVRDGTLHVGDEVTIGQIKGKIRAILTDLGETVKVAGPSTPIEILGFKTLPKVGETTKPHPEKKDIASLLIAKEEKKIKVIVKTDTLATLEAVLHGLPKEIEVVESGTGDITESDVLLAQNGQTVIFGLHVGVPTAVEKFAESEKVETHTFKIIYEFFDEIGERVKRLLGEQEKGVIQGEAQIVASFDIKGLKIAGCKVVQGQVSVGNAVHLKRKEEDLGQSRIKSLKKRAKELKRVEQGDECGILLDPQLDFSIGDVIISYRS
ncbi:MAG TPA: translation initiation factor IF-2 [Patescibacteria group bacterium]|nr:translation initiation factor IF-2 [Patescibacteria group bacterium]